MHRHGTQHWPFESTYLRDFEVLEERRNGVRFYPHTEQLPLLSQALNREFEAGLTARLAGTDGRADTLRKLELQQAAIAFCGIINAARPDHLHVRPYYTPEFVTQISVVQHLSETCPGGLAHRFRFFRGQAFLPEVYLSGQRLAFASHVLDRYEERAVRSIFHPLALFLMDFFDTAKLPVLLSENRPAVAFLAGGSMVAMPYKTTADECFLLTTLAPEQISTLTVPDPLPPLHLHYGPVYQPPENCLNRDGLVELILKHWRNRTPPTDNRDHERAIQQHMSFIGLVKQSRRILRESGMDEHTVLMFQDGLHGPHLLTGRRRP